MNSGHGWRKKERVKYLPKHEDLSLNPHNPHEAGEGREKTGCDHSAPWLDERQREEKPRGLRAR